MAIADHVAVGAETTPPKCDPGYPFFARFFGHEGDVVVSIKIGADGSVRDVAVLQSSGHDDLADATVEKIKACWKFKPATRNGTPVESSKTVRIRWSLAGRR